jgi:hypothetical protein
VTLRKTEIGQDTGVSTAGLTAGRRGLPQGIGMAGAALTAGALPGSSAARAAARPAKPTRGDVALLRFVAWAELVESDLWQQ